VNAHPLTDLFDHAPAVRAEIARREAEGVRWNDTRRTVELLHPGHLELTVTAVVRETATARTFRLARTDGLSLPPFLAGQHISLETKIGATATSRPFTISSSPADLGHYDVTVRRVAGGRVSNHLIDHVKAGDSMRSSGPLGTFHHNPVFHGDDLVFLAGGTGVAPAMSMIREIVGRGLPRRLHLVYGSRRADDIVFAGELAALARHPGIRVDHVISEPDAGFSGHTGLLNAQTVLELTGPLRGRMVYVCGPRALHRLALAGLTGAGHPRRRIRCEADGLLEHPEREPGWPAGLAPQEPVQVSVGGGEGRPSPCGRTLLEELEEQGAAPRAGCRSGVCGMCRVRVVKGTVFQPAGTRPRLSDERFGYVNSCTAYPVTDVEVAA
jgi:ferredoxin-NADP reductase/ferredoxin